MKKKSLKTVNIIAVVIFAAAFFLNIQANLDGSLAGLLGQHLIAQGTGSGSGSGGTGGSGSGSGGSGSGSGGSGSGGTLYYMYAEVDCWKTLNCYDSVGNICRTIINYGKELYCLPGVSIGCIPHDCDATQPDLAGCSSCN